MMFFGLLILALVGMPLFAVIAMAAMHGYHAAELDLVLVAMDFQRIGETPTLVALPLFAFAGVLVAHSKTSERMVDFTRTGFDGSPGGLAILALMVFALPLILYTVVVQQVASGQGIQVEDLFLAGLLPGVLMMVVLAGYAMWVRHGLAGSPKVRKASPLAGLKAIAWELPLPFVVIAGIHGRWLLVTEAAVVTAAWVLVTLVLIRREIAWSKLPAIITEAMVLVGAILVLLGMSLALANVMIDAGVPQRLFQVVTPWIDSRIVIILVISLLLLLAGMLLNNFAALVILAPLIIPVALAFGIDPVHLGIIFLVCLQIGFFTAPAGNNLFLASQRGNDDTLKVYNTTPQFLGLLLIILLIITFWPALSLWLPGRM